jgi:phosphoserine phosphatase RsbU/P
LGDQSAVKEDPAPMTIPPQSTPLPRSVLIVDDSAAQRKLVAAQLARWGYRVTEVGSGAAALQLCQRQEFAIILSDWMMPGMDGLAFCKAFRALPRESYGYFILLTSKSEKAEIASGLEHGADDFVTKPVNSDELRARLRAGERILRMQEELFEKNDLISATLQELQKVYDSLDRDLIEARKLQQTLVRDRLRDFGRAQAALMLHSSGHVGGDLVGSFVIDDNRLGVFSIDVSGHGVASAMMTARLAGLLSGASPAQNVALRLNAAGQRDAWPPHELAARLNSLMLDEIQVEQYFTMAYAEFDVTTGKGILVQAGHPHPVMLRQSGGIEVLGAGGLPIGLIPDVQFDQVDFRLNAGDRLFLISDGVTECQDAKGNELGAEGLKKILKNNASLGSPDLLEALVGDLRLYAPKGDFSDDVSGLILDYRG